MISQLPPTVTNRIPKLVKILPSKKIISDLDLRKVLQNFEGEIMEKLEITLHAIGFILELTGIIALFAVSMIVPLALLWFCNPLVGNLLN